MAHAFHLTSSSGVVAGGRCIPSPRFPARATMAPAPTPAGRGSLAAAADLKYVCSVCVWG